MVDRYEAVYRALVAGVSRTPSIVRVRPQQQGAYVTGTARAS
jgi:hypothetical protein